MEDSGVAIPSWDGEARSYRRNCEEVPSYAASIEKDARCQVWLCLVGKLGGAVGTVALSLLAKVRVEE